MGKLKNVFSKLSFLKKKRVLIVLLVLVVALAAGGLFLNRRNPMNQQAPSMSYIRTTTLSKGVITQSVTATGSVESANVSNVTTSLSYIVKSIEVQVGDVVEAGDVIIVLDTEELNNSIAKAEENLQEQIEKAQASYDKAYTTLQNAIAAEDEAEATLNEANTALTEAQTSYNTVINSVSYDQNAYDKAYTAQEKAGLALNEAKTLYNQTLDTLSVAGCEFVVTEKEVQTEVGTGTFDEAGNEIMETVTETVIDEEAVAAKEVCEARKTAYEEAENAYNDAKTNTSNAEKALNEAKNMINYQSYVSAYEQAKNTKNKAETSLEQAKKTVESAQESLNSAAENLEKSKTSETLETLKEQKAECTLRAETSGTVTSLNATVGSRVSGTAAVIQDTEDLVVSISIAETDINSLTTGLRVVITSDATDTEIDGKLTQLSAVASTQGMGSSSSSFAAKVKVNGGSQGLKIGMNAKCEIVISETSNVFSVPLDAIETDEDGKTYVYEKISGSGLDMEFERVEVIVGETNDYYAEISGDNVYSGMVIRSSAVLEEAISDGSSDNMFDMGNFGGMNGFGDMGNFGGGMPSGGSMPSGGGFSGGMPSGGGFSGGFPGGN